MMNSQELETAMRLNLNLLVIILNDSGYGMIKWKQKNHGLKEFGLDFSNPDFVKYAQSYGARGIRITKDSNFEKILSDLMNKKGIDIVDVPIDYSENDSVFSNSSKNIGGKKC
ncbi:acetolactate synthase large subunit, partial [archaeon]|nr:acetolactate synthase large subunit [archaeon]